MVDALELRDALPRLIERERRELQRRIDRYRRGRTGVDVRGRTVLLVDDGVATGATARVAAEVTRLRGARRIVLAVPVGPQDVAERFAGHVDEVVCLLQPDDFRAVGSVYGSFEATERRRGRARCSRRRRRRRTRRRDGAGPALPSGEARLLGARAGGEAGVGGRLGPARRAPGDEGGAEREHDRAGGRARGRGRP